jgi:hypothetical protein
MTEPILICTKCLGDHLNKYCEIYNTYPDNLEIQLQQICIMEKKEKFCQKTLDNPVYTDLINNMKDFKLHQIINSLLDKIHFPDEIMHPLWNKLHQLYSKEEIQNYIFFNSEIRY